MKFFRIALFSILVLVISQPATAIESKAAKPTTYEPDDYAPKELDLKGLDDSQIKEVLNLLNNYNCTCGCSKGTWANCIKTDKRCPFSRPMGARVVEFVKSGKSKDYIMGLFEGFKVGSDRKNKGKKAEDPNKIYPVSIMNAPMTGPKDAPVTIIEYSDYQCPFCKRVHPTIKQLLKEYPDKIRLVMMNNPLSFHKRAMPAALAARAAGKQGKFWEMHEVLFDNTKALEEKDLVKYAEKLGLNIEKFNKDRDDEALKKELLKEQAQALKNGASGVPAFFINGKKLSGAKPLSALKAAVEDALKAKKK